MISGYSAGPAPAGSAEKPNARGLTSSPTSVAVTSSFATTTAAGVAKTGSDSFCFKMSHYRPPAPPPRDSWARPPSRATVPCVLQPPADSARGCWAGCWVAGCPGLGIMVNQGDSLGRANTPVVTPINRTSKEHRA